LAIDVIQRSKIEAHVVEVGTEKMKSERESGEDVLSVVPVTASPRSESGPHFRRYQ
jgi:hypothetical protein